MARYQRPENPQETELCRVRLIFLYTLLGFKLKTDNFIELRYHLCPIYRHGKCGILISQVLLGYPATAGAESSDIDGDLRCNHFSY